MRRERCGILKRYVTREKARKLADCVDSNLAIQAGFYQVVGMRSDVDGGS